MGRSDADSLSSPRLDFRSGNTLHLDATLRAGILVGEGQGIFLSFLNYSLLVVYVCGEESPSVVAFI